MSGIENPRRGIASYCVGTIVKFKSGIGGTVNERETIRSILDEVYGADISQVILFGSRAGGDFHNESDFDVMVVLIRPLPRPEYLALVKDARMRLARARISADLLVRTQDEIDFYRNVPGTVSYHALLEGVAI